MPDPTLQLLLARHALGQVHSWDVPPIADDALNRGIYSPALAELSLLPKHATAADVDPLMARLPRELDLPRPSRADAAWFLARHSIEQAATGPPRDPLRQLWRLSIAARDAVPDKDYVGSGLDIGRLIGLYWSYTEPGETYYHAEQRDITDEGERLALLDTLAQREARAWLKRHP
jgi:hypothetical protein